MTLTAEEQDKLAFQICSELSPLLRQSLRKALVGLLAIRQKPLPWYHKTPKAFLIVVKSRTARKVWKIYDRHIARTPGLMAGVSYGDRYVISLFDIVGAIGWIVFSSGAEFAENLAKRLLDVDQEAHP
ncbi:hypothetical protein [Candidatus Phyllobacterium onerii]|uniref:hypothetical protein n=1 Tax=Candidatus Phyllobacterium onerii TaxID=3020828 RepID=UPI00232DE531|nr:hypothetical protein [Phyllobacterium sp. IY22]